MKVFLLVLVVFLSYMFMRAYYRRHWQDKLQFSLQFSQETSREGEWVSLEEVITNNKAMPLPALKVKFQLSKYMQLEDHDAKKHVTDHYYRNDLFSIGGYKKVIRRIPVMAIKRGPYRVEGIQVVGSDIFFSKQYAYVTDTMHTELLVTPTNYTIGTGDLPFRTMWGDVVSKLKLYEDFSAFAGLRDYQPGDPIQRINWKASARSGDWQVNYYDTTMDKRLHIVLHAERGPMSHEEDLREELLRLGASFSASALGIGQSVSIECNVSGADGGTPLIIPEGSSMGHLTTIEIGLAKIDFETIFDAKKMQQAMRTMAEHGDERGFSAEEERNSTSVLYITYSLRKEFEQRICSRIRTGAPCCLIIIGEKLPELPAELIGCTALWKPKNF
ncbi:MAG: DUF58 domain-containing protein [Lachnospiraceae bacterium]|nr:DUF58 domain-containing protein [Lachnospiraceae bacterium]